MPNITHNPAQGPLRVLTICSGPGQATWAALELQQQLKAKSGFSPFEVAGLFSDRPGGPALAEADRRSLPKYFLDSSAFHRGQPGQQMSAEDNLAYETALMELVAPAAADCLLVDGYQWTIGRPLLGKFSAVRIWPAGPACLKGFLKTGQTVLRNRVTYLTAPGGVGPVIITAPPITVDYSRFEDERGALALYLPQVMAQSGRAGARAVEEIGRGNFALDAQGVLSYKGQIAPNGLVIDAWN